MMQENVPSLKSVVSNGVSVFWSRNAKEYAATAINSRMLYVLQIATTPSDKLGRVFRTPLRGYAPSSVSSHSPWAETDPNALLMQLRLDSRDGFRSLRPCVHLRVQDAHVTEQSGLLCMLITGGKQL
jgi:hypothetical protein